MRTVHSRYLITHNRHGLLDTAQSKSEAFDIARRWVADDDDITSVIVSDSMSRRGAVSDWRISRGQEFARAIGMRILTASLAFCLLATTAHAARLSLTDPGDGWTEFRFHMQSLEPFDTAEARWDKYETGEHDFMTWTVDSSQPITFWSQHGVDDLLFAFGPLLDPFGPVDHDRYLLQSLVMFFRTINLPDVDWSYLSTADLIEITPEHLYDNRYNWTVESPGFEPFVMYRKTSVLKDTLEVKPAEVPEPPAVALAVLAMLVLFPLWRRHV